MSVFKSFAADDIVQANPAEVTTGIWPNDTGSLSAFYSASSQASGTSGQYYWDVYSTNPTTDSNAQVCFAVAYGHRTGAGHPTLAQSDASTLAPQAIYAQFRNLLLDPTDTQFTFWNSYASDKIYVISITRARMKERLDPGNWILNLSGSRGRFSFIDDSGQSLGTAFGKSGEVFNVVSGSLSGSYGYTIAASGSATKGGYGLVYPSLGIIVLNPDALTETVGFLSGSYYVSSSQPFQPVSGTVSLPQYNHVGLYNSIRLGQDFQARSSENISSTHYFVRLKAKEFNYSNNPSFYDESNGTLTWAQFKDDPKTFPTTIGLYNDKNELCAVAKLSQPVQKAFDKELNVKVRLDF